MPAASKLTFIPFTPHDIGLPRTVYRSDRDMMRGQLRGGFNAALALATGIADMTMCYTDEEYARVLVWCLGWMLAGWPYYIPFANLSDIKGGARTLRILWDLWHAGTLKFVRAPPDVRARALHDPESVLPHVIAAAALPPPPRPLAIHTLKFDISRFRDLLPHSSHAPSTSTSTSTRTRTSTSTSSRMVPASVSTRTPPAAPEELVLHPDTFEPILSMPLGSDAPPTPHERRQRCDIKKARSGKKSHSRKVGPLTQMYVLDAAPPQAGAKALKPLSQLPLPVMVNDAIGDYMRVGGESSAVEDIQAFSDVED